MLVTISAATDLAVTMAEKHNLTLIGFARKEKEIFIADIYDFTINPN